MFSQYLENGSAVLKTDRRFAFEIIIYQGESAIPDQLSPPLFLAIDKSNNDRCCFSILCCYGRQKQQRDLVVAGDRQQQARTFVVFLDQ